MRRFIIIVFIGLLYSTLVHAELSTSQIAKKYLPSVVTIIALDNNGQPLALGSGFFINNNGHIVTNHHVLESSTEALVKNATGSTGKIIEIIKDDPDVDLVVAKTTFNNTPHVIIGNSDTVAVGEDIVTIGNPAGLEGTVSKGIISRIRQERDIKYIQISSPLSPGSSGGPVFSLDGTVIGIATGYLDRGHNFNFAMPSNYLMSLEDKNIPLDRLPKRTTSQIITDTSLIEVVEIHYDVNTFPGTINVTDGSIYEDLDSIVFSLRNNGTHPIKNINLGIVYKNHNNEVISYASKNIMMTILPALAMQFSHDEKVRYFSKSGFDGPPERGHVEIRVLNYEIGRSDGKTPAHLPYQ